ncbi:cold-regulated protein 28-like isoform X2 [Hibiscus syriacus]|uniref:cold-regulated protein 28-like isoform X2 n=1 Tax=Hibiscus syriacus TaxID=106335 RepID=UPI00192298E1|nr:cold-regulated protein 28-like isoform X2 [Hibiscus syriacus]
MVLEQGETMVWTNEKHNSYLGFLEASFVKQLHYSISLRGCHPQEEMWEPCPTQLRVGVHNSSHQFLALQDGHYQKSNDPLLDSTADSSDNWESLLHHVTSAGKRSSETLSLSRETVVADGGTYSRSNTSLGGCTTEVWDQNFVDEEDQREKSSCVSRAKRLKMTTMYDASTEELHLPKVQHSKEELIFYK